MRQPSLFQAPSEWIPPENIPNLEEATEIAIDLLVLASISPAIAA